MPSTREIPDQQRPLQIDHNFEGVRIQLNSDLRATDGIGRVPPYAPFEYGSAQTRSCLTRIE